jgi:serine/threonine-protein kinase
VALTPGTRIGSYEIAEQIGVGGMGEVYRATDRNLGRDVAIKVLPAALAQDAERLARFDREARTLAALNHPNIATIHGLERSPGVTALVMELVEGPTVADRIAEGPIPVDEALAMGRQITEALEAAHERGIVHRDLKPANVKVRPDGTVKVLDYGLAKAIEPTGELSPGFSQSPTITTPAHTAQGAILGTAAYMSPEQARGKPTDRRTDIWAFGCVLFEMLTGSRAFEDEDVSMTLSRVLQSDADLEALPADVPARVRRAIAVCLIKDPKRRAADIHDVRLALEGAFETATPVAAAPARGARPLWRRALPVVAAALASGLVVGLAVWSQRPAVEPQITRFRLNVPARFSDVAAVDVAISPDGRAVVYGARSDDGRAALLIHPLDALDPRELHGEAALGSGVAQLFLPFFSPDGAWVGFVDTVEGALKRVRTTGGPVRTIAPLGALAGGATGEQFLPIATWGEDDVIVFSRPEGGPLWQVQVDGGTPEPLTALDEDRGEVAHTWPQLLPGGETVLFLALGEEVEILRGGALVAQNLITGERRVLVDDALVFRYAPSGHIVYVPAGQIDQPGGSWAIPFDAHRLQTTGDAVPLAAVPGTPMAIAGNGTAVYRSRVNTGPAQLATTMVWTDMAGQETPVEAPAGRRYSSPRVSPDGARVAVRDFFDDELHVWDPVRALTRLTFEPRADSSPLWTPDGLGIVFQSMREGGGMYRKAADGTGDVERLLLDETTTLSPAPFAWSPSGDLLFNANDHDGIGLLRMSGDRQAEILLDEPDAIERRPALSPDGRWLAYQSFRDRRWDVYVRPFPDVRGGLWLVSPGGGEEPVWALDGRTLLYVDHAAQRLMAAPVAATGGLEPGAPEAVLDVSPVTFGQANHNNYDVGPDGRFLFLKPAEAATTDAGDEIVVVLNFSEELRRLAPTD